MRKLRSLILGAGGQDGPYLASSLKNSNHEVLCIVREHSPRLTLLDVKQESFATSATISFEDLLNSYEPDNVFNLVGLSSVAICEEDPAASYHTNFQLAKMYIDGFQKFAELHQKEVTFIQASSSEMFGNTDKICSESTKMFPVTTYGKHKLLAHEYLGRVNLKSEWMTGKSAILFNHESEYRSEKFVSSKVATAIAEIISFGETKIEFGNLESGRDWGYAEDHMRGMSMMTSDKVQGAVIFATGKTYTVRNLLEIGFEMFNLSNVDRYVRTSSKYLRNVETQPVIGDSTKAYKLLKWAPTVGVEDLIRKLVGAKLEQIRKFPI